MTPEIVVTVFLALLAGSRCVTGAEDGNMTRALQLMAEVPLIDG